MSQKKQVFLTLSDSEWEYVNLTATHQNKTVDLFVSETIKKQIQSERTQALKKGYEEMAQINLELAQMCFDADEQACQQYEEKLTECE